MNGRCLSAGASIAARGLPRGVTLAIGIVFVSSQLGLAQSPNVAQSPKVGDESVLSVSLPQKPNQFAGFNATVTLEPPEYAGYMRVQIELDGTGQFSADRRFSVRVTSVANAYSPSANGIDVVIPVMARQGESRVRAERMVPQESVCEGFRVEILESGVPIEGYGQEVGSFRLRGNTAISDVMSSEMRIRTLWIGDVDTGGSPTLTAATIGFFQYVHGIPAEAVREELDVATISELPGDWRAYQRHDVALITRENFRRLIDTEPAAIDPLREWILLGGTLVVAGCDSRAGVLDRLSFADAGGSPTGEIRVATENAVQQLTKRPQEPNFRERVGDRRASLELDGVRWPLPTSMDSMFQFVYTDLVKWDQRSADAKRAPAIWIQPVAAGRVIGLPGLGGEGRANVVSWRVARQMIWLDHRRSLSIRRGVDPILGDRRFDHWLIPGVAQTPVYTFMGLLTVFVVLVGPVAYRQTVKSGRGYLMFVIAPSLALMTTLSMFAYGIVRDGFGAVARVRQLTWIDGASGDAGERTRATYFAGIRPADGLRFPGDAEVVSYPAPDGLSWEARSGESPARRGTVTVTESGQRFSSSFLPSREQRQFVTHRPRRGLGRLVLSEADGGPASQPPSISSTLPISLRDVVVRDAAGRYWLAPELPAEATEVSCQPLDRVAAAQTLSRLFELQRAVSPTGGRQRPRGTRSRRSVSEVVDLIAELNRRGLEATAPITQGTFEHWLSQTLMIASALPPSTFLAVADVEPDAVAVESAEIVESIRYVFGTLPNAGSPETTDSPS